ncbi:MAG: HDIG domain-containing protein [Balneola sp.]|nr:HDIG domain-containing protein [Balneola sp.]MBO6650715.1 HDIG domain-containing protein [Balneola sp.]MBO6710627.1 HDIG domain-containing protein [Balneola sp.]MBO6799313.1 HDIG domain-containing protein [Balneola sp.]MBO6869558.1 HDIG domain-containing protein [Balneola sp.]
MQTREQSLQLLEKYISGESLIHHSKMVAKAMEAYATKLGKNEAEIEEWWTAGLLHDLDWEKFPDEHPNKAVNEILPEYGYSKNILEAIQAHAPERTGRKPDSEIERYLFACDELSGFIYAVSLMRPTGFQGMKVKSVNKKLKTLKFAESVPREDIREGAKLINEELSDHILFLISVFE